MLIHVPIKVLYIRRIIKLAMGTLSERHANSRTYGRRICPSKSQNSFKYGQYHVDADLLQILKGAPMVGMLPEAMVIDQVKEGQLQILETDLILDAQDYGILTRKNEPVSDIAAAFINILLKNAKRK